MARQRWNLLRTIRLNWRTRPFLTARLAVYGVFFFATIGFVAVLFLILDVLKSSALLQFAAIAAALVLYLLARRYLRRYLTYVGNAPHIMAMVEVLKGGQLPKGDALIDQSTKHVDDRFPEHKRLFQVEGLIGKVLRDVHEIAMRRRAAATSDSGVPPPSSGPLTFLKRVFARVSHRPLKDAVIGYAFFKESPNYWESSRRGMVLCGQFWDVLGRRATRVFIVGLVVGLGMVGLLLIPGIGLIKLAPDFGTKLILIIGIIKAGFVLKAAVFEPFGLAYTLSRFIGTVADEEPDSKWAERLDQQSKKYRELVDRSENFTKPAKKVKPSAVEAPTEKAGQSSNEKKQTEPDSIDDLDIGENEDLDDADADEVVVDGAEDVDDASSEKKPEPEQRLTTESGSIMIDPELLAEAESLDDEDDGKKEDKGD